MKKIFLIILLAIGIKPAPAAADPITAAITAVNAFAATSAVAAFVVRIGVSLALSAVASVLRGKPAAARRPGIKTEFTTTGSDNPQSFVLGRYATGGNMAAPAYSHPNSGGTPNKFLTYVVDVSDVPGVTFSRMIVAGNYVDDLQASAGDHDLEGLFVDGKPHLFMTWHDGSQTAADAYMMANYSADSERPWAADMVGTGLAYAVVTFKYNRELFNALPGVRFEVDGIPLYDPRADSTVGGTGAQRWDDPTTWAQSDNNAMMIYNIKRGIALPDGSVWGGRVAAADLPLDNWFAAMNECDQDIALAGGGTEPQYRAGYEVSVDMAPADVIDELAKACSGEVVEMGGVYKMRVGAPALPVYFFSDDDVVTDEPDQLLPYPGLDSVSNAIHASYPAPDALWETTPAPSRYNAAWEAEDGDRRLAVTVPLPAVPYDAQVQRLMQAWINDDRRFRRHSLVLPPDAAMLEPLDTVAWTSARNGYAAKVFEIAELSDDLTTCLQSIAMRERDSDDFVWTAADDEVVIVWPSAGVPTQPARYVPSWNVSPAAVVDDTGTDRRPGLLLSWDGSDMSDASALEYEVRPVGQSDLVAKGSTTDLLAGQFLISAGIVAGVGYEAQARLVSDRDVIWSAWKSATAPNLQLGADDMSDAVWDQIEAKADASAATALASFKAGEFSVASLSWNNVSASIDQLSELSMAGLLSADSQIRDFGDTLAAATTQLTTDTDTMNAAIAQMSADLVAGVNGNLALIQSEQTARADADTAAASTVTTLAAQVDGHGTAITQQSIAVAGLGGSIQMSIDVNGRIAGWKLSNEIGDAGIPFAAFNFLADQFQISGVDADYSPFTVYTENTLVDGVMIPPGVYIADAFIRAASIGGVAIKDNAITAAKVAAEAIEADKIKVGTLIKNLFSGGELQTALYPIAMEFVTATDLNWSPKLTGLAQVWGVGAGGAGGSASRMDNDCGAGGGGAGGLFKGFLKDAKLTDTYAITIGAGGAGVTAALGQTKTGGAGGATSFVSAPLGVNYLANGGQGGTGVNGADAAGGAGGAASGADYVLTGGAGGTAKGSGSGIFAAAGGGGAVNFGMINHSADAPYSSSGSFGAATPGPDGEAIPAAFSGIEVSAVPIAGYDSFSGASAQYGGGGAGAAYATNDNGQPRTGGAGANGLIAIIYYGVGNLT